MSTVTIFLFLLIDLTLGAWVMSLVRPSEPFRVRHPVYHHTLKPNYDGLGRWGNWSYRICTNADGFKDRCGASPTSSKTFDIAFIGDSFTEGLGLPFEHTFVGMVATQRPDLRIANLGVVSYSPAIYLSKMKELFAKGYRFKHIIVFVDIGDAYDEANAYDIYDDAIVVDKGEPYPLGFGRKLWRSVSQYLPLTGEVSVQLRTLIGYVRGGERISAGSLGEQPKNTNPPSPSALVPSQLTTSREEVTQHEQDHKNLSGDSANVETIRNTPSTTPFLQNIYEGIYLKNYPKSEWTYNTESTHYGPNGVKSVIKKMTQEMQMLQSLAQSYDAKLSVGVYPWPGQITYDVVESLQVKIWREFCQKNCSYFYNAFPAFFDLVKKDGTDGVIQKYFFAGDVHFNELGNRVIADAILKSGIE